jgi:uncharacterized protein (TIGR03790 family)
MPSLLRVLALLGAVACAACGSTPDATPAQSSTASTSTAGAGGASSAGGAGGGTATGTGGASAGGAGGAAGAGGHGGAAPPTVIFPRTGIDASEIAVVVNANDPQSVALGDAYQKARGIAKDHVVTLSFPVGDVMTVADYQAARAALDAALGPEVQGLALTWTRPYRVDCMSVTSAFALGYDAKYCGGGPGCTPTAATPLFDAESTEPFTDLAIRPAMMLAASSVDAGKALIARGVAADDTRPTGQGYLVRTTDVARSVRWPDFVAAKALFDHPGGLATTYVDDSDGKGSDVVEGQKGVLFYFTGLPVVPKIETNAYVPGAVADHLTSFGGEVPASSQMSAMAWLEAGATASYGTVVEPCNFTDKFPQASAMLRHYLRGSTVLEAYWKSVKTPGEGLFVGEPLARPWGTSEVVFDAATRRLTIHTTLLPAKKAFVLEAAPAEGGPFTALQTVLVQLPGTAEIVVDPADAPFYRLRRAQ